MSFVDWSTEVDHWSMPLHSTLCVDTFYRITGVLLEMRANATIQLTVKFHTEVELIHISIPVYYTIATNTVFMLIWTALSPLSYVHAGDTLFIVKTHFHE